MSDQDAPRPALDAANGGYKAMFGCATCGQAFDAPAGDCPNPHHRAWAGTAPAHGGQCGAVVEIGGQPLPCQLRHGHAGEHRRRSDSGLGATTTEWEVRWADSPGVLTGARPLAVAGAVLNAAAIEQGRTYLEWSRSETSSKAMLILWLFEHADALLAAAARADAHRACGRRAGLAAAAAYLRQCGRDEWAAGLEAALGAKEGGETTGTI